MGKIKLVAIDLDGTVLNSKKTISKENIDAFKYCKEKGIEVVPVTGRPYSGLYEEYKKAIGCNYSIHTNGAIAMELKTDKTIISHSMNIDVAKNIADILSEFDCYYSVFYNGMGYLSREKYEAELLRYINTPMYDYIKITRRPIDNQKGFLNEISHCDNIYVNAKTTEIRNEICKAIKDVKNIFYTCSDVDDVEIGGNCSKGQTLLELAHKLNISKDEIMAIGDSGNDLNMLMMSGVSIAMGNASEEIQSVADFVTKDCENSGVAYAIKNFCI